MKGKHDSALCNALSQNAALCLCAAEGANWALRPWREPRQQVMSALAVLHR